eukprot:406596_1
MSIIKYFDVNSNRMSRNKIQRVDAVQEELDAIQRSFRDMEAKHRLSNDDSIQTIRMQRCKIEKLKTDNERLKEELELETRQAKMSLTSETRESGSNTRRNRNSNSNSNSNNISSMQESGEMYVRKIEIEKKRISELDFQIKKMEESILQQRSDMGGINANRETSKTIQKNIRMLENRLDKALVKYNEALGHNKKLRGTIDNLRRERIVFDGIYKKLENDLLTIKNEMASIIAEANQAYIARDYAQKEMLRLKCEADIEQKQFENEWKELTNLIDEDKKMKDYLINKDRENMNDAVVTSVLEQEQNLRKKLSKGAWQIVKDKAHIHMAQEKVKLYKESFDRISNATNINDIDTLVNTFITSEQENFKLFNQVNKLSNELERLEEQISNTQNEIELISGTNTNENDENDNECPDNQRQFILKDLKNKIKTTQLKTDEYKNKYQQSLKTMSCLKDGISKILDKIGIDDSNNKQIIDIIKNTGITETNIMEILGVIEQKSNELIRNYLSISSENDHNINTNIDNNDISLDDIQAEAASLGIGIGAGSLKPLVPTPASIFDDFSDEDEDNNDDDTNTIPIHHK